MDHFKNSSTLQNTLGNPPNIQRLVLTSSNKYIKTGDEFSLSCFVKGSMKPVFEWVKDDMRINPDVVFDRFLKSEVKTVGGSFVGILTIGQAESVDSGIYICKVREDTLSNSLESRISVSVRIFSTPDIHVYPPQITFIKSISSNEVFRSTESFYCKIRGNSRKILPIDLDSYHFEWYDEDNTPITKDSYSGIEFIEKSFVGGLVLKIRRPKAMSTYKCKVTDVRTGLFSIKSVDVSTALQEDVCEPMESGSLSWPRILRGQKALVPCFNGEGYISLQCNPTLLGNPPSWDMGPDYSECIRNSLIKVSTELSNFLNGYVSRKTDKYLPFRQIMDLPTIVGSNPLRNKEWEFVLKFIKRVIQYICLKTSILELERNHFLKNFYSKCISWLFASMSVSQSEKARRVVQLWRLILESSVTFAKKIPLNEHVVLSGDNSLMVKVGGLKRMEKSLRFSNHDGNVNVDVSVLDRNEDPLVVIAFSNELDEIVNNSFENSMNNSIILAWRSPIVTIYSENNEANIKTKIFLRGSKNRKWKPSCSRLIDDPSFLWQINVPYCILEVKESFAVCTCSKPGSYAILEVESMKLVQQLSGNSHDDNLVVSLCCIESLTLSILTTFGLSWQLYYKRYDLRWKQLEVSICISLMMIDLLILLNRTDTIKHLLYWLSLGLEWLVLEAIVSQITIVYLLKMELKRSSLYSVSKLGIQTILKGLSILLPFLYAVGVYGWWDDYEIMKSVEESKSLLVKTSSHSTLYLLSTIILSIVYILLSINVVSLVKKCDVLKAKPIELRLSLLKKSGILTVNLMLFVLCSIFFLQDGESTSILFALPCGSLGVALLLCYALGRDGESKENRRSFFPMVSCHTPSPLSSLRGKGRKKRAFTVEEGGPLLSAIDMNKEYDSKGTPRDSKDFSRDTIDNVLSQRSNMGFKLQEIPCRLRDIDRKGLSLMDASSPKHCIPSKLGYNSQPLSLSQILRQADKEKYSNINVSIHKPNRKHSFSINCNGGRISCSEYVEADLFNSYMSMKSFFPTANLNISKTKDCTLSSSTSCVMDNRGSSFTDSFETQSPENEDSFHSNIGVFRKLSLHEGSPFDRFTRKQIRSSQRRRCSLPYDFNRCSYHHRQNDPKRT
nr:uncharacterized protein LOC121130056 [Lepeophtheirus salmonis]